MPSTAVGYAAAWRANNPELARAQRKRHYTKHKVKIAVKAKKRRKLFSKQISAYRRRIYIKNRTKILSDGKLYRQRLKLAAITKYGGKCSCTGCTQWRIGFLTIDHPNNDGKVDRSTLSGRMELYRRLINNPISRRYRVMCWNCNCGRAANGGICPYKGVRH